MLGLPEADGRFSAISCRLSEEFFFALRRSEFSTYAPDFITCVCGEDSGLGQSSFQLSSPQSGATVSGQRRSYSIGAISILRSGVCVRACVYVFVSVCVCVCLCAVRTDVGS